MIRSNVHVHSTWCDGENTPREMADAALALGFTDLGFSSHAPAPFDPGCPGVASETAYRADIQALKEEYAGRLAILCGMERDYYAPVNPADYDYLIGSVHYLPVENGRYTAADADLESVLTARRERYSDDGVALSKAFYALTVENVRENKPTIVGHFDVLTKYNAGGALLDENSPAYRNAALSAMDAVLDMLKGYGGMVEVNTGAMARGLRDVPYPAPFLLRHVAQRNGRVIITGDSHKKETLNACFEQVEQLLRDTGFSTMAVLQQGNFVDVKL